jgi:hypothetical protein
MISSFLATFLIMINEGVMYGGEFLYNAVGQYYVSVMETGK